MVWQLKVLLLQQPLASIFTSEICKALSEMLAFDMFCYQTAANSPPICSSAFTRMYFWKSPCCSAELVLWTAAHCKPSQNRPSATYSRAVYVHASTKHWSDPSIIFTTMYFCSFSQPVEVTVWRDIPVCSVCLVNSPGRQVQKKHLRGANKLTLCIQKNWHRFLPLEAKH